MEYHEFRYWLNRFSLKDWLILTFVLLFIAALMFAAGLLAGLIMELPHRLVVENHKAESWHGMIDFFAVWVLVFLAYISLRGGGSVLEESCCSDQHIGAALITAAAIPTGFLLIYQHRGSGPGPEALFNMLYYPTMVAMTLGILIIILTPFYCSLRWKRICHARR